MTQFKTVAEVEARKVELETQLTAFKVAIPTLEFDSEAYVKTISEYLEAKRQYASIPDLIIEVKKIENAQAIDVAGKSVAFAITEVLSQLKVADLLGQKVDSLRYFVPAPSKNDKGEDVAGVPTVIFNPVTKLPSTGVKKSEASKEGAGKTEGAHRTKVTNDTETLSRGKFVQKFATAEEFAKVAKYPHVLVDSQPHFEEFLKTHPAAQGWHLTD